MRLTDLDPTWLSSDYFIFRNPTGGKSWLSCTRVKMSTSDQLDLWEKHDPDAHKLVVPSSPTRDWKFEGNDFNTMTVTPSIDASASGNWHGFITNGEIVGGM